MSLAPGWLALEAGFIALALLSCELSPTFYFSAPQTAGDSFVASYSCPGERVTVAQAAVPPADIAADSGRLRTWHETNDNYIRYEASGCGQHQFYRCRHGTGADNDTGTAQFVCEPK